LTRGGVAHVRSPRQGVQQGGPMLRGVDGCTGLSMATRVHCFDKAKHRFRSDAYPGLGQCCITIKGMVWCSVLGYINKPEPTALTVPRLQVVAVGLVAVPNNATTGKY